MVVEWLPLIGFGECSNVIKFGKIDGRKLQESLSNSFLSETLGIIGENEQIKFMTECNKVKNSKVLEVSLYGWGTNIMGQLATYGLNTVPAPK